MTAAITILDAMTHAGLFARQFSGPSWATWRAFLAALFALPMTPEQLEAFRQYTGRTTPPVTPFREAWMICGRRAGKSLIAALVVVFLACFVSYVSILAPGERGTIMLIAADRRQARTLMRYIVGLLESVPALQALIVRKTLELVELSNGLVIEIHTRSFRTIRGYTVCVFVGDEGAFWSAEDSAAPDVEILAAARPAMATVPNGLLLMLTTPYARRGATWEAYQRHFGKDDSPVLVWQAPTLAMNSTIDPQVIAEATERDEVAAATEYGAAFRSDVETFIALEILEAVIASGVFELPPAGSGVMHRGFVDPAGGSKDRTADSMTLAIAHPEGDVGVLDLLREVKPPFSPDAVVAEFAAVLKQYGITTVVGDRYAGAWPRERFAAHGIAYEPSTRTKSEIYLTARAWINSARVRLLDHPRLRTQFRTLERRTGREGRDTVDHGPGAHDDVVNSACGALVLVLADDRGDDLGITLNGWNGRRSTLLTPAPAGPPPPTERERELAAYWEARRNRWV